MSNTHPFGLLSIPFALARVSRRCYKESVPPTQVITPMASTLIHSVRHSRILVPLVVFCLYGVISMVVTWPVILHLGDRAIGDPSNDIWNHLWGFWWVRDEVLVRHELPIQTDLLNHPAGGSLYFIDTANALISLPFQALFGLVASYNIVILFQLSLAAFGAFSLTNHMVKNPYASFVAGVIYGFCPHLLAQVHNGISETISAGFLPLFILYFLRTIQEARDRNALYAGIFFFLTTFFNWYYGLFGVLFSVTYVAVGLYRQWQRMLTRAVIKRLLILGFTYTILIVPFLYTFAMSLNAADALVGRDPEFVWQTLLRHNMTDLQIFFRPGDFYSPDLKTMFGEDLIIVAYLGYSVLALAVWTLITYRQRDVKFWVGFTLLFFLFALGPFLYVSGNYVEVEGRWIPLPFLLFFKAFPLFSRISHPFRFVVMVELGLGVLAAFGLKGLYSRASRPLRAAVFTGGLCTIILAEYLFLSPAVIPFDTSPGQIPRFYQRLGDDPEKYAVLDLPVGVPTLKRAQYVYYQTAHHKAVPYGLNDPFPASLQDSYFMWYIVNLEFAHIDRLPPRIPELDLLMSLDMLKADGYRYVVVHDYLFSNSQQQSRIHDFLGWFVGRPEVFPDDGISVYRLP